MFDRRNDCSLMALEDHCCLLIVTLALVGGGGACRRCISVQARSRRGTLAVSILYLYIIREESPIFAPQRLRF